MRFGVHPAAPTPTQQINKRSDHNNIHNRIKCHNHSTYPKNCVATPIWVCLIIDAEALLFWPDKGLVLARVSRYILAFTASTSR